MLSVSELIKSPLSRKTMQSLLGKLMYLHKCVLPARTFINHILNLFSQNSHAKRIRLDSGFHKDIEWFISVLPKFNGAIYIRREAISHCDTIHKQLDAWTAKFPSGVRTFG